MLCYISSISLEVMVMLHTGFTVFTLRESRPTNPSAEAERGAASAPTGTTIQD
jgi:hypothetical protein